MEGDIAMEDWKDPSRGADSMVPGFQAEPFPPPDALRQCEGGGGSKAGFEKHCLSVAVVGSPPPPGEGHSPLPLTPPFCKKSGCCRGSLTERVQARVGFSFSKLCVPCNPPAPPAAKDRSPSRAPSPYVTIPPGLSPTTLLESPIFLSNTMGQASPTTGKLFMHANDNNPIRFGGLQVEDGPHVFSFKPSEQKPSYYTAEVKKESLSNSQHPSATVSVKTEANIQTAQEANLTSQSLLMQQQFNGQAAVKSGSRVCNLGHPAPDTVASGDGASPPEHGQQAAAAAATATEGDAKGDCAAIATAAAPAEDGYSWRKYGQKQVKHSEYPRSYYKCTHPSCMVKKKVERSHEGHVTEIIYKGTHNHAKPALSRRPPGDAQTDQAPDGGNHPHAAGGQPSNVEAKQLWNNGVAIQDWRGEGLEATSSPSVPGELSDSAASMQVHEGAAARFESLEGVDVAPAVSDEVDRDERAAHASMRQAAVDGESDELERKRRKLESCAAIDMSPASRAVREPRVVIQTTSEVDILDDGYRWRKYGQKVVKGNPNPRSYYKCTHPGCLVRKHVERASHDLKSVITTYEGKHNHEVPAARNSGHPGSAAAAAGSSQAHAGGSGVRRPELPSVQDGLMRLAGCGAAPFASFGLPRRDPLAPMGNFPYSLGHAASPALPSLPLPVGLGGLDGLKFPMLAPTVHPLLRHRHGMETAGLMVPTGEVKEEAMPASSAGAGAGRGPAFQQTMNRLSLGHQL